jgi:hypothetical protein
MPYAMAVLGNALLEELFGNRRPTLGEVLLHAKRSLGRVHEDARRPAKRPWLDSLARLASPQPAELAAERMEHLQLFNLLGDPLLRIRHPESVRVRVAEYATAGEVLQIEGTSDIDGACLVEAVCRRDRWTFQPPARHRFDASAAGLAAMHQVYRQANDGRWNAAAVQVAEGRFAVGLPLPAHARGPSHVRVFVQGPAGIAMGAANVYVRGPDAEEEVAVRVQPTMR